LRAGLGPRLEPLPGPVAALRLRALALGPPAIDQLELSLRGREHRRRLDEAIREHRPVPGAESLLEALPLASTSRVAGRRAGRTPRGAERRAVLSPAAGQ